MQKLINLLIILSFASCQSTSQNEESFQNKLSVPTELMGTWGLSNYLDSIVLHKEVAKYRMQFPAWFGIILEIKNDSLFSYGSITDIETPIIQNKDTIAIIDSGFGKWMLLNQQQNLLLKQFPHQETKDTNIYIYHKREDLATMTKKLDDVHKISSNLTQYFNKKLIAGTYTNQKNNSKVEFLENGKLSGFANFNRYEVRNYFGTYHPYKNFDVIFLKNEVEDLVVSFNWQFEGDHLVLCKFVDEKIKINGKEEMTEYFIPGKKSFILHRED